MDTTQTETAVDVTDNADIIRKLWSSMATQDLLGQVYADDVIWHGPRGRGTLMGDRFGRKELEGVFATAVATASNFGSELIDVVSKGEWVLSFSRDYGTRDSDQREFSIDIGIRWRVVDGKITELWEHIQDEELKSDIF